MSWRRRRTFCADSVGPTQVGSSKSGKTVALISAILEQYRTERFQAFERPSIKIDDGWKPVKDFTENDMGTEDEKVYFDKWEGCPVHYQE